MSEIRNNWKNVFPQNYRLIPVAHGNFEVYSNEDLCVYRFKSSNSSATYFDYIENGCKSRGKIVSQVFTPEFSNIHNHKNHMHEAAAKEVYHHLKIRVKSCPNIPVLQLHQDALRGLPIEVIFDFFSLRQYCKMQNHYLKLTVMQNAIFI